MTGDASIRFFDRQFERQVRELELALNPFEQAALPYLRGRVLDYGCGLGNLSVAAARAGCTVTALDASATAIEHLRGIAREQRLAIEAGVADLRSHRIEGCYDAVVSIGLLMFFDCDTAFEQLREIQAHVAPGGVAVVNVLVEGTTYLEMFDPAGHCLFSPAALPARFEGWELVMHERRKFPAPGGTRKAFATVVARKPSMPAAAQGETARAEVAA